MNTWGKLTPAEREAIRADARTFTELEINRRFVKRDDVTAFRIYRRPKRETAEAPGIDAEAGAFAAPGRAEEAAGRVVSEVVIISPEDFDYEPVVSAADQEAAKPIDERTTILKSYYSQDTALSAGAQAAGGDTASAGATAGEPPARVDHRIAQSAIKDQGDRGTCVAHASLATLETHASVPDDLSEQHAHYKFNVFLNRPHNENAGLRTTDAAPFLARDDGRVSLETDWPYIPSQSTINQMVAQGTYGPPSAAVDNQSYGIGGYKIIADKGLTGESIKNTRYLETLLFQGYDIVIGTWVSWDDQDNDGILDPMLDPNGNPIGQGGHAMLVVGYDRPSQYFIVKNSWDTTWGHDGYAYFHYNLVRSCFKYGYVVHSVATLGTAEREDNWLKSLWDRIRNWIKNLFGSGNEEQ
jgi:C1A family cysteine protease